VANSELNDYFRYKCLKGLRDKQLDNKPEYVSRLDYEIKVITKLGFAGYFLLFRDIINWARENNIFVGPGRGSAAGALTSYCLGITNLDPIKLGLLFERFLNPDRLGSPYISTTQLSFDEFTNTILPQFTEDVLISDNELESMCEKPGFYEEAQIEFSGLTQDKKKYISYLKQQGIKYDNPDNSHLLYAIGCTDDPPIGYVTRIGGAGLCDIDVDFEERYRSKVIQHVQEVFGTDRVVHIGTFGKQRAKAAIKSVAKSLGYPYVIGDDLTKLLLEPVHGKPQSISDSITKVKKLQTYMASEVPQREILQWAQKIENHINNVGVHASGIIIANQSLLDTVPLFVDKEGGLATQWDMGNIEETGLIKFDFLGLDALTKIHTCIDLVKELRDITINIDKIPLDDDSVFLRLRQGDSVGIFQLEASGGMRDLSMQIRPAQFEDLIALIAIYRPGPLSSSYKQIYLDARAGNREPEYLVPELEPILGETAGWCIYQDELVHTPNGKVKIHTLKDKDIILNGEYKPTTIKHIWNSGTKNVIRYDFDNNSNIACTADHPVKTITGYLPISKTPSVIRYRNKQLEIIDINIGINEAWILGMVLGDGCTTDSSPTIATDTLINADIIKDTLQQVFPELITKKFFATRAWYVGAKRQQGVYKNKFNTWLRRYNLFNIKANKKQIPDIFFKANSKLIDSLLAGLWDSDGCIHQHGMFYTSTSTVLLDQMSILLDFRYITYYRTNNRIYIRDTELFASCLAPYLKLKTVNNINLSITGGLIVSRQYLRNLIDKYRQATGLSIKQECVSRGISNSSYFESTNAKLSTIIKAFPEEHIIENFIRGEVSLHNITEESLVGKYDVYDIEVDGDEHSFIVGSGDGIIVHNCIYQEQVMEISKQLCGYTGGEADEMRKAIGKKKQALMDKHKPKFMNGWVKHGLPEHKAETMWDTIVGFSAYGFNKTLDKDTQIATINGVKRIEDCSERDTIYTLDSAGNTVESHVVALHDHGIVPLWEIEFDDGTTEQCTLDHKWATEWGQQPLWRILNLDCKVWGKIPFTTSKSETIKNGREETSRLHQQTTQDSNRNRWTMALFSGSWRKYTTENSDKRQIDGELQIVRRAYQDIIDIPLQNVQRSTPPTNCICRGIVRISYVGLRRGYDLEVDHPSHNFLLASGLCCSNSHAAAYALITYQTAYLKAHYTVEYMCACMISNAGNTDQMIKLLAECKAIDIQVLPPDINKSRESFHIDDGAIRFGLGPIKNLGLSPVQSIIKERHRRKFKSLRDFCERIDLAIINRRKLEALISSGSFDNIGANRATMLNAVDKIWEYNKELKKYNKKIITYRAKIDQVAQRLEDIENGVLSSKGKKLSRLKMPAPVLEPEWPTILVQDEMSDTEIQKTEHQLLGFYVSSHPMEQFYSKFGKHKLGIDSVMKAEHKSKISFAAVVTRIQIITTKSKKKMAFITLEDLTNSLEGVLFTGPYTKYESILEEGTVYTIDGTVEQVEVDDAKSTKVIIWKMHPIVLDQDRQENIYVEVPVESLEVYLQILDKYAGELHRINTTLVSLDNTRFRFESPRKIGNFLGAFMVEVPSVKTR